MATTQLIGNSGESAMRRSLSEIAVEISKQFLKRRWLITLLVAIGVVVLEVLEHRASNNRFVIDPNFLRETALFGFFLPIAWGLILTLLMHTDGERVKAEYNLDKQNELARNLNNASRWDELTDHIVRFPSGILPVIGTALHVYNPESDRYELAAEWSIDGLSRANLTPMLFSNACHTCEVNHNGETAALATCLQVHSPVSTRAYRQYCLPLIHGELTVALLHFDLPVDLIMTAEQIRILKSAAHEMALALESTRLQRSVISQAEATEAERRRISQSLHDTLGQNVSYLHLKLDQMTGEDALLEISQIKEELERMRDIAEEAYQQVRGTLADLHPTATAKLTQTLFENSRPYAQRSGFKVDMQVTGDEHVLNSHVKRQVLFICREALNNIEKHAQATQVGLSLNWTSSSLTVKIRDNGVGFDLDRIDGGEHYGLSIMHERAQDIQGRLTLQSQANNGGTEISLWVPLQPVKIKLDKELRDHRNLTAV
jgi:signal transduction histidine kinase